mmetsp:Transcript_3944/g.8502  ORF Transcript_3944/g.8502 Transcript_3944/m.8502 type:complete len:228 (+) Transcript_3944:3103-3786(+)
MLHNCMHLFTHMHTMQVGQAMWSLCRNLGYPLSVLLLHGVCARGRSSRSPIRVWGLGFAAVGVCPPRAHDTCPASTGPYLRMQHPQGTPCMPYIVVSFAVKICYRICYHICYRIWLPCMLYVWSRWSSLALHCVAQCLAKKQPSRGTKYIVLLAPAPATSAPLDAEAVLLKGCITCTHMSVGLFLRTEFCPLKVVLLLLMGSGVCVCVCVSTPATRAYASHSEPVLS